MRTRRRFLHQGAVIGFVLSLLLLGRTAYAKTVWIILLPGTSLADWQRADAPHLHHLLATGCLGLMNTRTARTPSDHVRETPESAALTLGAGSRATGGPEAIDFLPESAHVPGLDVTAGQLYTRRMGMMPPRGAVVNIEWPQVLHENAAQGYDLYPGNLVDALRRADVAVEAGGGPLAFAAAADGNGTVLPYALPLPKDICVIWDAGSDLPAADALLGRVMGSLADGQLIVLSPCASNAAYTRGERLCPVAVWGRDVPPGLLRSASTRRAGLVTNTDFATQVGAFFGLPISAFPARPFGEAQAWEFQAAPDAAAELDRLNAGAMHQWDAMRALPYLALFWGFWIIGAAFAARRVLLPPWVTALPPALVLATLLSTSPLSLALWLGAGVVSAFFLRPTAIAALVSVLLIGDMLLGDPLMRQSLLGYSAIEGARYYGLGNEAMGVLIGSVLIVADEAWRRLRAKNSGLVWLGLLVVTALLGSPFAGAKAGGFIVALAAFGAAGWLRSGRVLGGRTVVLGAGAIALALGALVILDARLGGSHASHLGQAAQRLTTGGSGEWADIIRRKLAVEGHLLWHSAWAVPVWGCLAALTAHAKTYRANNRVLFVSGLVAAGACLAVNDAGAVAASLCLVMLWSRLAEGDQEKARCLPMQTTG